MSKPPNWRRLWHRKPLDAILVAAATAHYERTLKWTDLTLLALGSIIGAGVFVLTGQAAAEYAGPAIVVSFVIAGVVAAFSALCYAELSGLIPLSGSAFVGSNCTRFCALDV
jgi:APA family basic amino acid/polyamine antiporter